MHLPAGQMLVICKNLLAQLVDKLVKAQIDFGFDFVVQELFPEDGQGVVGAVVVQIQGKEDALHL